MTIGLSIFHYERRERHNMSRCFLSQHCLPLMRTMVRKTRLFPGESRSLQRSATCLQSVRVLKKDFYLSNFMSMSGHMCPMCMPGACGGQKRGRVPCNWNYGWVCSPVVLGTKLRSSARGAEIAPNP